MPSRLIASYRIRSDAKAIDERARTIAIEQSVEMPVSAVREASILSDIVGQVSSIADRGDGWFDVDIALATSTIGDDAGQLLNMLFGNTSLHEDVILHDVALPDELLARFGGPRHGLQGLRRRARAENRALTCSALKPQGLSADALAELAFALAQGGLDFVKDDHGLADQSYSPFETRVRACAGAVRKAAAITGAPTRYIPSLSGHFGQIERQLGVARDEGIDTVMIAPAIAGVSTLQGLVAAHPDFAFITHPTMSGAARVSPVLFARLFRLFGADGAIFPNHGGRFGYSSQTCGQIASRLREPWGDLQAGVPVPAGGMNVRRVPEMLRFYGKDAMLLIGGALLSAPRENLAAETASFVRAVAEHDYGEKDV
ncbi:RuBisCO large subunit C-terminal-like domain-containing protein [Methylocapsa sp. S129]|uniref:RuBisCO large subunit C-terminal-like domain-containing protein n=1 Tax=Methylocapsa sp. S129 TaxID=1641869 RepID=UPI00131D85B4|nr:RuBisCO large subunit C-terminal-like domain-containing protein [Methylocapsa sp. S129]